MTGTSTIAIRPETPADIAAIGAVLGAAFPTAAETGLVERLRSEGELVLALIAAHDRDGTVGYVAFTRLAIDKDSRSDAAVGLAPLAVAPDHQRRGIGSALVREGLATLKGRGERLVFVLGDPAYYGRFGFRAETAAPFRAPYRGPHFMALRLAAGRPESGHIRYPAAFARLP